MKKAGLVQQKEDFTQKPQPKDFLHKINCFDLVYELSNIGQFVEKY